MFKICLLIIYLYMFKKANLYQCPIKEQAKYEIDKLLLDTFYTVDIYIKINKYLSEINPNCFAGYLDSNYLIQNLKIDPQNGLVVLDNSFFLGNFTYFIQPNFTGYESINLNFRKLDKLDLNSSNIFTYFLEKYLYKEVKVNIFDSIFDSKSCYTNTKNGIFNRVKELSLSFSVKFLPKTCPFIFQNSNLEVLNIYGQSQSFIKHNTLGFLDLNLKTIHSTILYVSIHFYKANLTQRLLNKLVFKNVEKIEIIGLVNFIYNNIFEELSYLVLIYLKIENLQYFLSNNNKWLSSLNKFNRNYSKILYVKFDLFFEDFLYLFPDSDLCLFRHFPHSQLVYPLFYNIAIIEENCSCTLLWLLKETYSLRMNFTNVDEFTRYLTDDNYEPCFNRSEFLKAIEKCDFNTRFKLCDSISKIINKKISIREHEYNFKIILFLLIVMSPFLGLLALASNFLNILVVFNIRSTDEKYPMNRTILYNSVFNILYVFIYLFHMINQCVTRQGIFCSSINRQVYSQYFYMYIFLPFGNFLKLLSNLSSLSISVFRFILLDNNERSFFYLILVKKRRLVFTIFLIFSIVYFLLYFMMIFFTTSINRDIFVLDDLSSYVDFPDTVLFVISYISKRTSIKEDFSIFIFGLFVLNYAINDLIIFLIFCLVEILILVRAKEFMKRKIKMISCTPASKLRLEKSIDKTTKIILLNVLLSIIFRAIDFGISTFLVDKRNGSYYEIENICFYHGRICYTLTEINEFTFLLSISFNFIIYYHLNLNFRQVANNLIEKLKIKKNGNQSQKKISHDSET
ncbi:unnamed protein product [Brachionus calyciflorus]|uniref:G-protein coupled receptors family 1 profile domain-containing protein n=1 Tax=Brachionus calyciflorus TaxID=104777 RepID=A0A813M441_9BILA|nr:unnamed protein product [Brachionus calyciflorus]